MVEAANRNWRHSSGVFSKQTVEEKILPILNRRLGCNKNYNNYQSRLKWFKSRWLSYSTILKYSSGFGFDPTTKRFTAPNKVWEEYLKVHPKDSALRYGACDDFDDLEIAVGNGVAVGKNSIGSGGVTYARTLEVDEDRDIRIDDLQYDMESVTFVAPSQNESSFRSTSPLGPPDLFEFPMQRTQTKRSRAEYEDNSNSNENTHQSGVLEQLTKLTTIFEGVYGLLEKKKSLLEMDRSYTAWDAIKEVPDLDEDSRLDAFNLLGIKTKKEGFLKMTPEERRKWVLKMMQK